MKIGVKFLFKGNLFFAVLMEEAQAKNLIANWVLGKPEVNRRIGDVIMGWALDASECVCIHLFEPDGGPVGITQAPQGFHGKSGL